MVNSQTITWDQATAEYPRWGEDAICSHCNDRATEANSNVRFPKHKDIQGWSLLHKLIYNTDLENARPHTLGRYWYDNRGIGCTLHMHPLIKQYFRTPTKLSQHKDWVYYMKTTKMPSQSQVSD